MWSCFEIPQTTLDLLLLSSHFGKNQVTFVTSRTFFLQPLHRQPYSNGMTLIIRVCRHILPDGRHCRGAAVRGRVCCRHHLDARTRLHNMARARRLACIPRLRVPMNPRDLALNRAEIIRVVGTGNLDFDSARTMLWAIDLAAAALPAERASSPRRSNKFNVFYHVPVNHLFTRSCTENHSQVPENTAGRGEG